MYYIGIDWADQKHDICVLDEDGKVHAQYEISNDLSGFEAFAKRIKRLSGQAQLNIERSDGLLVDFLVRRGFDLFVTPALIVHHRRPRRSKSDQSDAYLIANLLRMNDPDCRRINQRSDVVEHLRQLLRAYDGMLQAQRRNSNRLIYLLKQYYPAALKAFCQAHRPITLAFLKRFPTPQIAREATAEDLYKFLRQEKYRGKNIDQKVTTLLALLSAPSHTTDMQDGLELNVMLLIPILKHIQASRGLLEKKILSVFATHPDANWWLSIPGAQRLTAARLLAWIGDDRNRFPDKNVLQAVAGTVPVTRRSGKSKSVQFRTGCSHKIRAAVDALARQSVKRCSWAKEYYQSQLDRGHAAPRAYRALANRWLSIIWKLWQTRVPYDEQIHLANRASKGLLPLVQQAS